MSHPAARCACEPPERPLPERSPLRSHGRLGRRLLVLPLLALRLFALAMMVVGGAGCTLFEREDVLVLVHAEDAFSLELGAHYARLHRIPSERILRLPLSAASDPTEIDAVEFREQIARPIESHLARVDPEGEVEILVTTRGL